LRDDKGLLVGTGQGYAEPEVLAPGESGSFRVEVKGFSPPTLAAEPYPDLEKALGPRPRAKMAVVGRPGAILESITASARQKEIDAQGEWDYRAAELVHQWEARKAAPPETTGYRFLAFVAQD
jgi:hypothetical protein